MKGLKEGDEGKRIKSGEASLEIRGRVIHFIKSDKITLLMRLRKSDFIK